MAVISGTLLEVCKPDTVLLHTGPVYGGTHSFISHYLSQYQVHTYHVAHGASTEEVIVGVRDQFGHKTISAFFTETPANPTLDIYSIAQAREIADAFSSEELRVPVIVDNTYMGPLMCRPHEFGADIVVYSATKNLGGHSDVIAGAATGATRVDQQTAFGAHLHRRHLGSYGQLVAVAFAGNFCFENQSARSKHAQDRRSVGEAPGRI